MRIMIVINDPNFFFSHRLAIAEAAINSGSIVSVACPEPELRSEFSERGIEFFPIPNIRRSLNIFKDFMAFLSLLGALRSFRPDIVHLVTAKSIFHGGIAARLLGIPVLAAFSGMGFIFTHDTIKAKLLRSVATPMYKLAINRNNCFALFQNHDDLQVAEHSGFLTHAKSGVIQGSGVDLTKIIATRLPDFPPVIVLPARMLRDKGIIEFVEAARILKGKGIVATFRLIGDPDPNNPSSIEPSIIQNWVKEGIVEWKPHTKQISLELSRSHLVVLPSYREGFPKTLIDAAAAGRAVATSDVPGCRDAIKSGETGVLFAVRDAGDLACKIEALLKAPDQLTLMGANARAHAERNFDIHKICARHIKIYQSLLK